jgi:Cu(I)/Ag(I) efflux system membrane protein CusA/SilA
MIERLIEGSVRNRFVVLLVAAALTVWGVYAVLDTPVDAIPDLGENQVIVFTDWPGRSPKEIEDQISYPLSRKLQGLAGVKAVRSSSEFNFSMVTLIFDDSTDFYFARERVLERLTQVGGVLPPGVTPYLAPDATALGQVFWYTVEPSPSHPIDPGRLWALNKFYITQQLNSAPGVSEVAPVGGMPLEYQVDVEPERLRAYGVTVGELYSAVARSNLPAGGGVVQKNNAEYIVRGVGWIKDKADIENTVVKEVNGTPVYVKTVATVQLGPQFRRSVFEKDGSEVVGGVVLMRHGENPLRVTEAVKAKIAELQPGLPEGVRIVPAYDRTRLIHGAIDTLTEVMWHEMVIAAVAILLILVHVRSVFVITVTLPLSVLFSFLLMWVLRRLGIVDVQANIMSLAGITISIGILVDQAIVMVENATHTLKEKFGDARVTGDTRELVIPALRTVGRPIFFSVLIMLLSFVPVFMLSGREGKYFHPLAFTKSFALIGVALISVTVVPALIPSFIRGRLRSEEENWIVRSFIRVYKPLLTWALRRRNLVMWAFAALLILAAGVFPVQALFGLGADERGWRVFFLLVFALVTFLTVLFTRGVAWQAASLATLVLLGVAAYHVEPKIGVSFMPALDEGSVLDMPVTVPRASVTQAADDLKARDALLRGFPEVESVIGKAGRADTPTDPAPLDMVETFVNFRPYDLWPKRVLRFSYAERQTREALRLLEERGFVVVAPHADDRDSLVNEAAQKALERFDETMRELALRRYTEFEAELGPVLTRFALEETLRHVRGGGHLAGLDADGEARAVEELTARLAPAEGPGLARHPAVEAVQQIQRQAADHLAAKGVLADPAAALRPHRSGLSQLVHGVRAALGGGTTTLADEVLAAVEERRAALWRERVEKVNWELFDRGTEGFTWYALEELVHSARGAALVGGAARGAEAERFADEAMKARLGKDHDRAALEPFAALRGELEGPFKEWVLFWPRQRGPKGDLVDDEFGRVLQVPGWSNIFTQPIINRIEMLSTGVRTDIGIKVFGPDLDTVVRVSKQIEAAVKPVTGARDVIAAPIMGKGYLEVTIDREKAARYGVTVEDVQTEIEMALGGRVVTYTVEDRDRFPVRVRYARAHREDEEAVRRLLVPGSARDERPAGDDAVPGTVPTAGDAPAHQAAPGHAAGGRRLIPLSAVADVRVVEGPAVIKSENGRLLNYVTLNVRGRDAVGFVEEARRVVEQTVKLPEGVHVEWAGEFEHQERAARTLRWVFPAVILIIFLILYLTYHDLADAGLMMLAVPEALAGGALFLWLFPKIVNGWESPPVDFSVAVWVGLIACFGMATETGIIMLVYLREAIEKRGGLANIKSLDELREAVIEGAVHRLRPKLLTEGVAIVAIFPMVFSTGVGAEVLYPMALPVLGGLLISDEVVDIFLPVRFFWVRRARWLKLQQAGLLNHQKAETGPAGVAADGEQLLALTPAPAADAGDGVVSHAGEDGGRAVRP